MKQIICLFITFFSFSILNAQFQECITPPTSQNMSYNSYIIDGAPGANKPVIYYVKIYLHYIKATGSSEDITSDEVTGENGILDRLETDFKDHNIEFVWDCYINYIYDEQPGEHIFSVDNHDDGIDMYLFGPNYNCPSGSGTGSGCGLANGVGNSSELYVTGELNGETLYNTGTLSHEIGHVLFLFHTFHETEDAAACCEYVTQSQNCIDGNTTNENGNLKGDFVCDTPAESRGGFDDNCIFIHLEDWETDFFGETYMPDATNFMTLEDYNCKTNFTTGQGKRMRNSLSTLPHLLQIILPSSPIIISPGTIISGHAFYDSDIILNSSLTVTGTLSMGEGTKIIVQGGGHLIIDSGVITNYCGKKWKGIEILPETFTSGPNVQTVYGTVSASNGAIISNAEVAITKKVGNLDDATFSEPLILDLTIIKDCDKAFYLERTGNMNSIDGSTFNGCTFINCVDGGELYRNPDVTFTDCTFTNITNTGLTAIDSPLDIYGCTFEYMKRGLDVLGNSPLMQGTKIGKQGSSNTFASISSESVKIKSYSASDPIEINYNNFIGSYFGILISGASDFLVENNTFFDQVGAGTLVYDTESTEIIPLIGENEYISQNTGVLANRNNISEIHDNCFFNSVRSDINLSNTKIHEFQGSVDEAAGNCFTKSGVPDIKTNNLYESFDYHILINETTNCKITDENPDYNAELDAAIDPDQNCGSNSIVISGPLGPKNCPNPKTDIELEIALANLLSLINYYTQTAGTNIYHRYLLKKYQDCYTRLLKLKAKVLIADGDPNWRENAISFYDIQSNFHVRIFAYTLMVENEEYVRATNWLNSLDRNVEEVDNFVSIQQIHLAYLQDRENYVLSFTDETLLNGLADKVMPLNGFARSLYQTITGLEFPITITYADGTIETRKKVINKIIVYPNPSNGGVITIDFSTEVLDEINLLQIFDSQGRNVYTEEQIDEKLLQVNTESWNKGIYYIKYQRKDETFNSVKFINI